ncbi:NfeD family protein [Anoxybacterium hadale]|uniref:NfeD family protein n=1 Tax=Anoxybacterium hadale TaxID=3408580 RepID=UPI003B008B36
MIPGLEMSQPLIWVMIAVIFAVIEGLTMGLTTIWFTVGGVAACIIALIGGPLILQVAVFLIVSVILLYFTRPLAEKRLKVGHEKNNIEQLIGKTALVMETIKPYHPGQARLNGLVWTAVTEQESEILEKNELAIVVRVEGVKLVVEKVKGEEK